MEQHAEPRATIVRADERDEGPGLWVSLDPERTGAGDLWMGHFAADPGFDTGLHHHSCDTGAWVVRGRAVFVVGQGDSAVETELGPGDWIFVPAGLVHAERTIGDETAEFVMARDRRGGPEPTVYLS